MTCVECGTIASFWLCSNACALAYARKRGRRDCAICSYDAKTGRIGRHDTTKVCAECRAHEENAEWMIGRREIPRQDVHEQDEAIRMFREEQDRPLLEITATTMLIARLIVDGARVPVPYEDQRGRRRGNRERWRALSTREIARRIGCSQTDVVRLIRHIEK